MQRIFTHPDLPDSVTEVKLIKGISGAWLVFISDRFGVTTNWGMSEDKCYGGSPLAEDLLDLACLHVKHSMRRTNRN